MQSTSSRAAKYLIINAIILLIADIIFIVANFFVNLPRFTLLAPICFTAASLLLLFIALLELRK